MSHPVIDDGGAVNPECGCQTCVQEYKARKRTYKRQCRVGIFGVALLAFGLVGLIGISNNNSKIKNTRPSRRNTGKWTTYTLRL